MQEGDILYLTTTIEQRGEATRPTKIFYKLPVNSGSVQQDFRVHGISVINYVLPVIWCDEEEEDV